MKKKILRALVLSCVLCLSSIVSKAQWVVIPDTAFVSYLQTNFPSCMNGNLMDTTCGWIINSTNIDCGNSNIQNLTGIQYFKKLQTLLCSDSRLVSLSILPNSLHILFCDGNHLTSLPELPDSLILLDCQNNELTVLPILPNTITYLHCFSNHLVSLPSLPDSLTNFGCHHNQLTVLPTLPALLMALRCDDNLLNSLPALPSSLYYLDCHVNQLYDLPTLPNQLDYLFCDSNNLATLPDLPDSLRILSCTYNQLIDMPELPDSLQHFFVDYNLQLRCLPQLKVVFDFTFSNTAISCLPNYPQLNYSSNPSLIGFPICDSLAVNPCLSTAVSSIPNPQSDFRIFPNPLPNATSSLTISVDETLLGSNLSITDITGREVMHSAVQIRNPQFDIRNFLPGVYLVSVTAVDGRKAVKKLLIE